MNHAGSGGRHRLRWVVKVGGSLSKNGALRRALAQIERLSKAGFKIVVAPGGGEYADFIRRQSSLRRLDQLTTHQQAILSVRQFGLELAQALPSGVAVRSCSEARARLREGATPVFLPDERMTDDLAPIGWDTTSDTIAAAILLRVGFGGLVLLKSMDGVERHGRLAAVVPAAEAARVGVVDQAFPKVMRQGWDVFILNGAKPGRLVELLESGILTGTRLSALPHGKR
ncbi:MAG: hypothetical protein OEZ32_12375 [Nitrospinota bacterium]|nr:hypothetical protein [Nitrospinota bacterium]